MRELYGHPNSISAIAIIGPYIISADMDCHVRFRFFAAVVFILYFFVYRVVRSDSPREIVWFLLGNTTPVRAIYRHDDDTVVCISSEKVVKFFSLRGGVEVNVNLDINQPLVSLYSNPRAKLKKIKHEKE